MSILSTNEGITDRVLRIIVGVVLLSLVVVGPKTLWGLVGLVPILTGIIGVCPVYSVFGVNTCSMKSRKTATQS